jgi:FkbM family methyltransferase
MRQLIYDVGAHEGQDTDFYLKKGFNVIAVEASPQLCAELSERFSHAIRSGALTVVNVAISDKDGEIDFYLNNEASEWGTANPEFVARNEHLGTKSTKIRIRSTPLDTILKTYGVPYYLKIDIEGMDTVALSTLQKISERPKYISIESEKVSWRRLLEEFRLLTDLGYKKFKIVNQALVTFQKCPLPAGEGLYVDHTFPFESSGLFGTELPGEWMDVFQAIEYYKPIFYGYALNGDFGVFKRGNIPPELIQTLPDDDWYDTHAVLDG